MNELSNSKTSCELLDAQIDANEWKERYAAREKQHLHEEATDDATSDNELDTRFDNYQSEDSSDEQGVRRGVKRRATDINEAAPVQQHPRLQMVSPPSAAMTDAQSDDHFAALQIDTPPASPATQGAMEEIWRSTVRDEMHARVLLGDDVNLDEVAWYAFAPDYVALLPSQSWPRGAVSALECIVCHDPYVEQDMVITLPCAHLVHEDCGTEWLHENNACPVCTTPIVS
ncbi:hypothetical protein SDRG_07488 [Saprolegnia diclina VS20]|uniref:RING-type domain-containing protein n=1 Tax=Saprolegnia diclina (strain VS20) TaxID=1156394 RepID=T0QKM0_SAPDV|nr:hypothetical protein SDRG_07488 [Saprolegnia diclina VS20]EQC35261.1 hypothetical protein SDRG_07488 [Saprolegnia diclina VS20]|eukprot:XP_008611545.1 hypothetical protein SDRG_07488 [Saprolegnia diclina VS20]